MTPTWAEPPDRLDVPPDEVHVWRLDLERPDSEIAALAEVLTDDERERALKMKEGPIRNEFVAARGLLRSVLSRYRALAPREFRFRHGPTGKPYLDAVQPELFFNISHSSGLALLALSGIGEVGVDIEKFRAFKNELGLARRYFIAAEADDLAALPAEVRQRAFFHVWTAKEAFLKAVGHGLANGLERIHFVPSQELPLRVLHIDGSEDEARAWSIQHVLPAEGFLGALAHRGQGVRLVCWRWPTT
jgi:4'-phosphopantetheinyl transferase